MRLLLLTGLILGTAAVSAQTRVEVYPDDRMMWSDMLLHAENGVVRDCLLYTSPSPRDIR